MDERDLLLHWCLLMLGVCLVCLWFCERKTRKPPAWRKGMPEPRPDERSSIDEFRRIIGRR